MVVFFFYVVGANTLLRQRLPAQSGSFALRFPIPLVHIKVVFGLSLQSRSSSLHPHLVYQKMYAPIPFSKGICSSLGCSVTERIAMEQYHLGPDEDTSHISPLSRSTNAPGFSSDTAFLASQCLGCSQSSAVVAALWQRISALEAKLFRVTIEKSTTENIVRSIAPLQSVTPQPLEQSPWNKGHGNGERSRKTTSVLDSLDLFNVEEPLIELSDPVPDPFSNVSLMVVSYGSVAQYFPGSRTRGFRSRCAATIFTSEMQACRRLLG